MVKFDVIRKEVTLAGQRMVTRAASETRDARRKLKNWRTGARDAWGGRCGTRDARCGRLDAGPARRTRGRVSWLGRMVRFGSM
jgi:hypothetical protein